VKSILNISLQITANLTIILEPFLPFTVRKLSNFLQFEDFNWHSAGRTDLLKPGHQIGKAKHLFQKMDDTVVEQQVQKLMNSRTTEKKPDMAPVKDPISYEQFSTMDIRTGTILKAEKVPKTTKLIQLQIDTGVDIRTVVSGIAEYFKAEELVGKKVSILLNLQPRKLKGIESRGMILMAENPDGSLYFVTPDEGAENGSEIK
jgi:methionyl-tRNA synthetase